MIWYVSALFCLGFCCKVDLTHGYPKARVDGEVRNLNWVKFIFDRDNLGLISRVQNPTLPWHCPVWRLMIKWYFSLIWWTMASFIFLEIIIIIVVIILIIEWSNCILMMTTLLPLCQIPDLRGHRWCLASQREESTRGEKRHHCQCHRQCHCHHKHCHQCWWWWLFTFIRSRDERELLGK